MGIVGDVVVVVKVLLEHASQQSSKSSIADVEFAVFHSRHRAVDTVTGHKSGARKVKETVGLPSPTIFGVCKVLPIF
jgi:hypothetical protein